MCWGSLKIPSQTVSHMLGLGQESMDFDQIFTKFSNFGRSSNSHRRRNHFRSVLFCQYVSKLTTVRAASLENENPGRTRPECAGDPLKIAI